MTSPDRRHPPKRPWQHLIALVAIPMGLVILLPVAAVYAICWPFLALRYYRNRRRMLRRLHAAGRIIPWPAARSAALAGNGRLLMEIHHKGEGDLWWIDADVDVPLPPAQQVRSKDVAALKVAFGHLLSAGTREWCRAHLDAYVDRTSLVTGGRDRWRELPEGTVLAIWSDECDRFRD